MESTNGAKINTDSNGEGVKDESVKLPEKTNNDDVDELDDTDFIDSDPGSVNLHASLPPTPRSSEDEENVDDVAGPSHADRDHAAFHLPTNLEIREGVDYQCPVQDWGVEREHYDDAEHEVCIWRPTTSLSATEINDYLSNAYSSFNIEQDRAMYILQRSNYNIEEAKHQLAKRRSKIEAWNEEDTTIFKQALQTYGKRFHKMKPLLPHKTAKEIINFYYVNKKKMEYRTIITEYYLENPDDRKPKGGLAVTSNAPNKRVTDPSEKKQDNWCCNCEQKAILRHVDDQALCSACFTHFRNYHLHRPCIKPFSRDLTFNESVKCPKGMIEVVERFLEFAAEDKVAAEQKPTTVNGEDKNGVMAADNNDDEDLQIVEVIQAPQKRYVRILEELRREEVIAKGNCSRLEHALRLQCEKTLGDDLERFRVNQPSTSSSTGTRPSVSASWTYKEKWQALFAFQRYGKDFDAVAEVLETKTPVMVKNFYCEMQEQIDNMLNKTDEYYQKLAEKYDFGTITKVDVPEEVIDID